MPTSIPPFTNVPAPGDGVTSAWAQQLTQYAVDHGVYWCTAATRPTGAAGRVIYETDTKTLLLHDGTGWVIMSEPVQTFTPAVTGLTNASLTGTYQRSNGYIDFTSSAGLGAGGAATTQIALGIPKAPAGVNRATFNVILSGPSAYVGMNNELAAGQTLPAIFSMSVSGALIIAAGTGPAAPFTWAPGHSVLMSGRYRMQTRYL